MYLLKQTNDYDAFRNIFATKYIAIRFWQCYTQYITSVKLILQLIQVSNAVVSNQKLESLLPNKHWFNSTAGMK